MKVTYIGHSGFLLEMEEACFLFDYYEGEIPVFEKRKPLLVFVSHAHEDHYNPQIFSLAQRYPNTKYILSDDLMIDYEKLWKLFQHMESKHSAVMVGPGRNYIISVPGGEDLQLATLKSTDEGLAYLISYKGKTIFHAGDLHLWLWEEESAKYRQEMQLEYEKSMKKVEGRKIDVAFVPLDPRLENTRDCGMEYYLQHTDTSWVFPMHCWGYYTIIDSFLKKHPEYENIVQRIQKQGEVFER